MVSGRGSLVRSRTDQREVSLVLVSHEVERWRKGLESMRR